ncbi:MAG: AAA family ATPase [Saprospiraceae bacterium]|nr:AAA family ATPase [Saprospiraceae bacterium]
MKAIRPETAQLLYRELEKIAAQADKDPALRLGEVYRLFLALLLEATKTERLQFATLFARLAYICHKWRLDKKLQYYLHTFRKYGASQPAQLPAADLFQLGLKATTAAIEALSEAAIPPSLSTLLTVSWPLDFAPNAIQAFRSKARVVVLDEDPEKLQLIVRDEAAPEEIVRVQYHIADRNEPFTPGIKNLRSVFGFPVALNLLDVEIGVDGIYRPRAFVFAPDHLVDVSAIAGSVLDGTAFPWQYLLDKFLPKETTPSLMLGNIANFYLDELITRPETTYTELKSRVFRLNPLGFCLFSDREVVDMMGLSQKHYTNLRQVLEQVFAEQDIATSDCFVEPSFYSETYGLQGRLDVFYRQTEGLQPRTAIVELKSGKIFKPNVYGINHSHFTQTLLYDLLVRSTFGTPPDPLCYILYSGVEERPLRYAPTVKVQQYEALQLRNTLLGLEYQLAALGTGETTLTEQGRRLFGQLTGDHCPANLTFLRRDLNTFAGVYEGMNDLEKKYFVAFSGFIAREHRLAKTGVEGVENLNGQAMLWRNSGNQKRENFDILDFLEVRINKAGEEEPLLGLGRTDRTPELANFRVGDIAVLYPGQEEDGQAAALRNQVLKCTIVEIGPQHIWVRLRSRQRNAALLEKMPFWTIEHDLLDSSFNAQYRGLFEFAGMARPQKELLLGLRAPELPASPGKTSRPAGMTPEQETIFQKILASKDYFLLWGPPGTGKTSVMLRHLVAHFYEQREENLMILAYTNRAVDEICEAIESIGEHMRDQYLRIGSRYATESRFFERLLESNIEKISTRSALKSLIGDCRIVVGTVASIAGKPELFKLKTFHRAIIDEASQILEPSLVGLLPHFPWFALIGDHKQLPAVVSQDDAVSAVQDADLHAIGLNNLRQSLFERLYKRCIENGWTHAYAQLSHQGRMHQAIMDFPNGFFYEKTLQILPPGVWGYDRQVAPLETPAFADKWQANIFNARAIFIPTPIDESGALQKVNVYESATVADLVDYLAGHYAATGKVFHPGSIGVITPYRAQIALIRQTLSQNGFDPDQITVDTVERYQGGARDIIIISLCTNTLHQLNLLSSLSDEGIDRKLNVALTRAREQLIVLGNPELLAHSAIYRELISFCTVINRS